MHESPQLECSFFMWVQFKCNMGWPARVGSKIGTYENNARAELSRQHFGCWMASWHVAVQFHGVSVSSNCLRGGVMVEWAYHGQFWEIQDNIDIWEVQVLWHEGPISWWYFLSNECQVLLVHCSEPWLVMCGCILHIHHNCHQVNIYGNSRPDSQDSGCDCLEEAMWQINLVNLHRNILMYIANAVSQDKVMLDSGRCIGLAMNQSSLLNDRGGNLRAQSWRGKLYHSGGKL
jgi:hypothetical protein